MLRPLAFLGVAATLVGCGETGRLPADDPPDEAPGAASAAAPDDDAAGPRVVFLGTSLTAGLGLMRPEDTYVARLGELAEEAGLPIDAVNAGVSGETSAGGLRRLDWVLREPVDVLVLELGANDGLRGQSPLALARNLEQIIDRTRARYPGADVIVAGMEAPPNLGGPYVEAFRQVFRGVAEESGAHLVPFLLEGVAGDPELNQGDGIHPTAAGHRRMARNVWPVLEEVLRARAAGEGDDAHRVAGGS